MTARRKPEEQVVRIAPLGELRAYTISEHELEKLETGAPVSDLLTIGLCLLSAALTVLATILSTPLPDNRFTLFFCSLLIFAIGGGVCTFVGWRGRVRTRELAREIRARMPAAPVIQQLPPTPASGQPLQALQQAPGIAPVTGVPPPASSHPVPPPPPMP